ncbi:MAG: biotin/lipoyl-binding protein [Chloroflexi bacterium]|nr:biotin/lipoyl-binding protein [Chloroflexota bacterium]
MAKNYRLIVQQLLREVSIEEAADGRYLADLEGKTYELELVPLENSSLFRFRIDGQTTPLAIRRDGMSLDVFIGPDRFGAEIERSAGVLSQTGPAIAGEIRLTAPMTGQVTEVLVAEGDEVSEGDGLLVMVAMKMNNEIRSPAPGKISQVNVAPGDAVDQGDLLLVLDSESE